MKKLKVKICGMRDPGNIREIAELKPDYMGFIFYTGSSRYAGDLGDMPSLPGSIRKVGVFVNALPGDILDICRSLDISMVQLHGSESPEHCIRLRDSGMDVMKAFSIGENEGFERMEEYTGCCDYFLLDTADPGFGGTGRKFDWGKLDDYGYDKPFFLSGGIGPQDAENILSLDHPRLSGLDLNSRFESAPGIKTREELDGFIKKIRMI